jgi:hypothetical protein
MRRGRSSGGAEEQGSGGAEVIRSHEELDVYRVAFDGAMRVFEASHKLHEICMTGLEDVERVVAGLKWWVREHPELIDERL